MFITRVQPQVHFRRLEPHYGSLPLVCHQSAATLTIIDSSGLTAAVIASAVNLQAGTRMWRKCLAMRSGSALGKPFIIPVNGSAETLASTFPTISWI